MKRRTLRFAVGADEDLVRLFQFLGSRDPEAKEEALATIREALVMMCGFPFSCRKVDRFAHVRECVIPFGRTGSVAAFEIADDDILILAVRHQREDDYH